MSRSETNIYKLQIRGLLVDCGPFKYDKNSNACFFFFCIF